MKGTWNINENYYRETIFFLYTFLFCCLGHKKWWLLVRKALQSKRRNLIRTSYWLFFSANPRFVDPTTCTNNSALILVSPSASGLRIFFSTFFYKAENFTLIALYATNSFVCATRVATPFVLTFTFFSD